MIKPAIEGGHPVRKKFLIFGKPKITYKEIQEVIKTVKSGWLGTGPKTHLFENNFKDYVGSKHAIALNSCTAGLHLALDILNIKEGDEVITTPITFPATTNVIIHHKAKPIFADININTWNVDPVEIEKKITSKTKAIVTVDLHGRPCEYKSIQKIAKKYRLFLIDDAAHAAEAIYYGKHMGQIADITAFSFYVTKNIMTGEGGMLTTNNSKWAEEAQIRSLHGISRDAWKRYSSDGFVPYETLYPGYKYNMTDIQASFGIHQLANVEKNLKIRQRYWQMYDQAFKNIYQITIPAAEEKNTRHARHLYAIVLKTDFLKIKRNQFLEAIIAEGIGAGIHFTPVHMHKYYRLTYGFKQGDFPHSEYIGERIISLPLSPALTVSDIEDVIKAVIKLIKFYQK